MKERSWLICWFSIIFTIPVVGVLNYIFDPYQQYRIPALYPIKYTHQRFQNPGFIKNSEYDAVVVGASLIENFDTSEMATLLGHEGVLKVSLSGGAAAEQTLSVRTVFLSGREVDVVYWCLDVFSFIGPVDRFRYGRSTFPFYLYDDDVFNDYKYLLSADVLKASIVAVLNPLFEDTSKPEYDPSRIFQWQHNSEHQFNSKSVQKAWINRDDIFSLVEKDQHRFSFLKNSFDENFLSVIERAADVEFIVFLPPYSILEFKKYETQGILEDKLKARLYMLEKLLSIDNVSVFDFQDVEGITHDLSNYKDLRHYHQKVNSWMLRQIRDGKNALTRQNLKYKMKRLRDQIEAYELPASYDAG